MSIGVYRPKLCCVNEYRFLIDCGEGTQRQLLKSGLGFRRLDKVLITHGHLDHILARWVGVHLQSVGSH